ncbi:MAG: hypothetical protein AAF771_04430 [Pseudomonadota bacterium]
MRRTWTAAVLFSILALPPLIAPSRNESHGFGHCGTLAFALIAAGVFNLVDRILEYGAIGAAWQPDWFRSRETAYSEISKAAPYRLYYTGSPNGLVTFPALAAAMGTIRPDATRSTARHAGQLEAYILE